MYSKIAAKDLLKIENPIIIDIRENHEFISGHIPGSLNISMKELLSNYNSYLNKRNKYFIYCQSGSRSKKVCEALSNNGYYVVEIMDGYDGWKKINY